MTSFQKKLFFFQSETPVELQLQPAKICFNNLYSMGSEFSRGSITPIVQKWMPLKWDELLSLYKKYRSFNVHETHYEFELRIVFQLLDPSSKGIISSIDLFAGLALLLSTSLEPKFKFMMQLLDIQGRLSLNECEIAMICTGASRGLSLMKKLKLPPEKLLHRIVSNIYQEAIDLQMSEIRTQLDEDHDDNIILSKIKVPDRVDFNYLIESARHQPDIIYYMYDLNSVTSTDMKVVIAQQRRVLQSIAEIDYQLQSVQDTSMEVREYIETLPKKAFLSEHEQFLLRRRKFQTKEHAKSRKKMTYDKLTSTFGVMLLELLLATRPPHLLKGWIPLRSSRVLQELIEKASDYTETIQLAEAQCVLTSWPTNQLGCIPVNSVTNWFKAWRLTKSTDAISVTASKTWKTHATNLYEHFQVLRRWKEKMVYKIKVQHGQKSRQNFYFQNMLSDSMNNLSKKNRIRYKGSIGRKTQFMSKSTDEKVGFKMEFIPRALKKEKKNVETSQSDFLMEDMDAVLQSSMKSGLCITFLLDVKPSIELKIVVNQLSVLLNEKSVLKSMQELYSAVEVEIVPFQYRTEEDYDETKVPPHCTKYCLQVFFMSSHDYLLHFEQTLGMDALRIFKKLVVKMTLESPLSQLWQEAKNFSVLFPFQKKENEEFSSTFLLRRMFNQYDVDGDSFLNLRELNTLQQALGEPPVSSEDFHSLVRELSDSPEKDAGISFQAFQNSYSHYGGLRKDVSTLQLGSFNDMMVLEFDVKCELNRSEVQKLETILEIDHDMPILNWMRWCLFQLHATENISTKFSFENFQKALEAVFFSLPTFLAEILKVPGGLYSLFNNAHVVKSTILSTAKDELGKIYPKESLKRPEQELLRKGIEVFNLLETVVVGVDEMTVHVRTFRFKIQLHHCYRQ